MKRSGTKRSVAEIASTAVALLLLVAVVGAVAYFGMAGDSSPPAFSIKVGGARSQGSYVHVPFEVKNEGEKTASEVTVQGVVKTAAGELRAETTFDYLAGNSSEEGVFIFPRTQATPEIRVVSYQLP